MKRAQSELRVMLVIIKVKKNAFDLTHGLASYSRELQVPIALQFGWNFCGAQEPADKGSNVREVGLRVRMAYLFSAAAKRSAVATWYRLGLRSPARFRVLSKLGAAVFRAS